MTTKITFVKINLACSRAAASHLFDFCVSNWINVILLQEPALCNQRIQGTTMPDVISMNSDHPRSIFVFRNYHKLKWRCFVYCLKEILSFDDANLTGLNLFSSTVTCFNLASLKRCINLSRDIQAKTFWLLETSTQKNSISGGFITDNRSEKVIEFLMCNDLCSLNSGDSLTTFVTANGRSWIDLIYFILLIYFPYAFFVIEKSRTLPLQVIIGVLFSSWLILKY